MESYAFYAEDLPIAATESEMALVERAKTDPAAAAELYRKHYSPIAGYIRRRVVDHHQADDLIAEVFLSMVRYLPRFRHRGIPFRSWLYRLATSQVSRWARRQRRWATRQLEDFPEPADSVASSADTRYADAELVNLVLLTLPQQWQEVLGLFYVEEKSLPEISRILGCPVGTVKSRLSRGRELMRVRLCAKGWRDE